MRNARLARWGAAVLVCLTLAAAPGCNCGTVSNPSDGGSPPGDSGALPDGLARYIAAVCDWVVRCEPQLGPAVESVESCRAFYVDLFSCFVIPLEEAFGFTFTTNDAAVDACVAAFETFPCDGAVITGDECSDIFAPVPGTVPEGGACASATGGPTNVCADGLYCNWQPSMCSACEHRGALGEDCSARECATDLRCDFTTNTCVALAADGAACTFGSECVSGICSGTPSICTGPLPDGADCSSDSDCQSTTCVNVCVTPVPAGGPCMDTQECQGFRACIAGTCADRLPDGAACTEQVCLVDHACIDGLCAAINGCDLLSIPQPCGAGPACADTEFCDFATSMCMPRRPVGQPCTGSDECVEPAHCDFTTGLCEAPSPQGGPCTFDSDCIDGLSCTSGDTCEMLVANGAPCTAGDDCDSDYCDSMTMTCADLPVCAPL
jgi:hypothetical protein